MIEIMSPFWGTGYISFQVKMITIISFSSPNFPRFSSTLFKRLGVSSSQLWPKSTEVTVSTSSPCWTCASQGQPTQMCEVHVSCCVINRKVSPLRPKNLLSSDSINEMDRLTFTLLTEQNIRHCTGLHTFSLGQISCISLIHTGDK